MKLRFRRFYDRPFWGLGWHPESKYIGLYFDHFAIIADWWR